MLQLYFRITYCRFSAQDGAVEAMERFWGESAGRIRDQDLEAEAPPPLDGAVWARRILIGAQLQVCCADADTCCGRSHGSGWHSEGRSHFFSSQEELV